MSDKWTDACENSTYDCRPAGRRNLKGISHMDAANRHQTYHCTINVIIAYAQSIRRVHFCSGAARTVRATVTCSMHVGQNLSHVHGKLIRTAIVLSTDKFPLGSVRIDGLTKVCSPRYHHSFDLPPDKSMLQHTP